MTLSRQADGQVCALNGTVVATCEPGSDLGAQINNAIKSLGTAGGIVSLPAGTYSNVETTVTVSTPNISIVGTGSAVTVINYTGAGDFLRVQMQPFTVMQAGRFAGFTLNLGYSAVAGVHIGDTIGAQLEDIVINGPAVYGGSQTGVWFDNETAWTERTELLRVHANCLRKDFRFTNSGGTATTDSFGYTRFLDTRANIGAGQTMISFEGGTLYNSLLTVLGNAAGGSGTSIISMSGKVYGDGPGSIWQDNLYLIQTEQTSGSGTMLFDLSPGTTLAGSGYIKGDAMSYGNSAGATILPTLPYFGSGSGSSAVGPSILTYLGARNNFWQGFGSNFLWNGSNFMTHGDSINNGGAAIMNQGTGNTAWQVFVVPSTGGKGQTISANNLSKYDVASFGSKDITLNRSTTIYGNLKVVGSLSKSSGSFQIDHPLDPENKYLYHSFVESPDMLDVYNGNVTTDAAGVATIELPAYFEALNRDFRYQLTAIGRLCQVAVVNEVKDHRFTIKSSKPRVRVSWQVTGIRHDAYANANRVPVEEDKPANERGQYLHPELFVKPTAIASDTTGP